MNDNNTSRGGASVGYLSNLSDIEHLAVRYLRLWCDGAAGKHQVEHDFHLALGVGHGTRATHCLADICELCTQHGRRPLVRHQISCRCLGADESCFANFVSAAAEGQHEDAALIATLLVRADYAIGLADLAREFGLALKRISPQSLPKSRSRSQVRASSPFSHLIH